MGDYPHSNIRISDTERDLAMTALGDHLATGRLELGEYEVRCTRVIEARMRADLEELFTDLPEPHPDLSAAVAPGKKLARTKGKNQPAAPATPLVKTMETIGGLALLLGVPGAILATIFAGMWWLFIPVVVVFMVTASIADSAKKKSTGKG
jgi:hypothetical protein